MKRGNTATEMKGFSVWWSVASFLRECVTKLWHPWGVMPAQAAVSDQRSLQSKLACLSASSLFVAAKSLCDKLHLSFKDILLPFRGWCNFNGKVLHVCSKWRVGGIILESRSGRVQKCSNHSPPLKLTKQLCWRQKNRRGLGAQNGGICP